MIITTRLSNNRFFSSAVQTGRNGQRSSISVRKLQAEYDGDAVHSSMFFIGRLVDAECSSMKSLRHLTSVGQQTRDAEKGSLEVWQEIAVQILFSVVRWARNTYAFPMLTFEDQVALLKYTWSEIFVLNAASCVFDIPLTKMAAAKGSGCEDEQMREVFSKTELFRRTVEALKELQLDTSEIACLKAISLFTKGKNECWGEGE